MSLRHSLEEPFEDHFCGALPRNKVRGIAVQEAHLSHFCLIGTAAHLWATGSREAVQTGRLQYVVAFGGNYAREPSLEGSRLLSGGEKLRGSVGESSMPLISVQSGSHHLPVPSILPPAAT